MNRWQRKDWRRRRMVDRSCSLRARLRAGLKELTSRSVSGRDDVLKLGVDQTKGSKGFIKEGSEVIKSKVDQYFVDILKVVKSLPRDFSVVRVKNRCVRTGVGSSVMRKFRLSRFQLRSDLMSVRLPGYRKASW